ncbi:hypothetical protein T01_3606 [Trichinella spiralis]|uniref:Uncharacterized protein n=1 Tax=Trichinella spiralis TaxID=6334 RepID=A0A0V0YRY6_TRISP|nr:hypothetical protein T01_3606 [Trichinella spiralis]
MNDRRAGISVYADKVNMTRGITGGLSVKSD